MVVQSNKFNMVQPPGPTTFTKWLDDGGTYVNGEKIEQRPNETFRDAFNRHQMKKAEAAKFAAQRAADDAILSSEWMLIGQQGEHALRGAH